MLINPESVKNKIGFARHISIYLINHGIPLLGYDKDQYYFADTILLREVLQKSPLLIKLAVFGESKQDLLSDK